MLTGETAHLEQFLELDGLPLVIRLLTSIHCKGLLREKLLDVIYAVTGESQGAAVFAREHSGQQVLTDLDTSTMTFMEHLLVFLSLSNLMRHPALVDGQGITVKDIQVWPWLMQTHACSPLLCPLTGVR